MPAYYNEHDPKAAAWLRELIRAGLIAPGDVDERSIEDVLPTELAGYRQCHFFAGIGGWSYALRLAGIPDDYPVWTGSCPCQPFSAAGKRAGFADERHLWPAFFHLIGVCRPAIVLGEQVAGGPAGPWIDLVQTDLEALGYACGAAAFPACSVGAPHIRQRLYWVAHAECRPTERQRFEVGATPESPEGEAQEQRIRADAWDGFAVGKLGDASGTRLPQRERNGRIQQQAVESCARQATIGRGNAGFVADSDLAQPSDGCLQRGRRQLQPSEDAAAGFWRDTEWIWCRDGKYRPVEPGTFPLAHGVSNRVVKLRGYGNAIVPEQAAAFIQACMRTMA